MKDMMAMMQARFGQVLDGQQQMRDYVKTELEQIREETEASVKGVHDRVSALERAAPEGAAVVQAQLDAMASNMKRLDEQLRRVVVGAASSSSSSAAGASGHSPEAQAAEMRTLILGFRVQDTPEEEGLDIARKWFESVAYVMPPGSELGCPSKLTSAVNLKYATASEARSNLDILRSLTGGGFTYKGREYDIYVKMLQSKARLVRNKFLLQAAEILRDATKDDHMLEHRKPYYFSVGGALVSSLPAASERGTAKRRRASSSRRAGGPTTSSRARRRTSRNKCGRLSAVLDKRNEVPRGHPLCEDLETWVSSSGH